MRLVEKTAKAKAALRELLSSQSIPKLVGFGNCEQAATRCKQHTDDVCGHVAMLKRYAPELHDYYSAVLEKIHAQFDDLELHFRNSAFSGITFNIGQRVVTYRHRDHLNIPFGLCCVTALGDFDHTKGGHLILWDLNLIIQIPPGASYLIPSAILTHSNVDIAAGETRMSITQFFAGGLARWVECGGMSQKEYERQGNQLPSPEVMWTKGIELLRGWTRKHARTAT